MKYIVSVFIFLLTSYISIAQEHPILLDGEIDKYSIVMEIDTYDSVCNIKYFYLNQYKDILLEGTIDDKGQIKVITEDRGDANVNKEKFDLKKTSTGYTGTWVSGNKLLPVNLKETSPEKYKNQYEHLKDVKVLKQEDPYNYIKTSNLIFILDSSSINGNIQVSWYREKYSGIIMPRIKNGYTTTAIQKINNSLLEVHLQESKNYLECSSGAFGEYLLSADYIFSNKNLLSININVSWYCGGAHPDFGSEGLNFNTQTGELMKFDELFWFTNTKPPEEYSALWSDYRDTLASKVVEVFKKLYPEQMKPPDENSEGECDYSDEYVWHFPNWYFTDKGLYLGAVFGRVARSCDSPEWSVIPYRLLKNYLSPQLKLKLPD